METQHVSYIVIKKYYVYNIQAGTLLWNATIVLYIGLGNICWHKDHPEVKTTSLLRPSTDKTVSALYPVIKSKNETMSMIKTSFSSVLNHFAVLLLRFFVGTKVDVIKQWYCDPLVHQRHHGSHVWRHRGLLIYMLVCNAKWQTSKHMFLGTHTHAYPHTHMRMPIHTHVGTHVHTRTDQYQNQSGHSKCFPDMKYFLTNIRFLQNFSWYCRMWRMMELMCGDWNTSTNPHTVTYVWTYLLDLESKGCAVHVSFCDW